MPDSALAYLDKFERLAVESNSPPLLADNKRRYMRVYTKIGIALSGRILRSSGFNVESQPVPQRERQIPQRERRPRRYDYKES